MWRGTQATYTPHTPVPLSGALLTFSPFSPGRPATPGSPCRKRTLCQEPAIMATMRCGTQGLQVWTDPRPQALLNAFEQD